MSVVWLRRAADNLRAIVRHIAQDNPAAARALRCKAERAAHLIGRFPHMGRVGRVPGTREFVLLRSYILVYRVVSAGEQRVEILDIRHAARLWPRDFGDLDA